MNPEKFLIKPETVNSFTTVYQIMDHARRRYPHKIAYRQMETRTDESSVTFGQFAENTEALRAAMLHRGISRQNIALLGETSQEWISVYMAVVSGVAVCVPIDKELPPETMATQLKFAEVKTVFCSKGCLRKLLKILPECETITTVVVMRGKGDETAEDCETVLYLPDLLREGRALLEEQGAKALPASVDPDALCVIIYTSGTTGANKGVMLSNRNIMGTLRGCARLLHYPDVSFSVLPVNHSYELHAHIMSCMYCGTTVCINNDLKYLVKNLERFQPEMSCMVPMMLDLLVRKMKKQIAESGKQAQFDRAMLLSKTLSKVHIDIRRRLFKEVLAPLGGKLRMIICGGAALSQDTADFLTAVGVDIYNGYGITECAPVAAVNPLAGPRRFSVGHLLPTMEARIADPDEDGNGEIQLKGDNVMLGYYKAPQDTAKVFTDDGWFRTGDIGHIDKYKFLYISGRLKNLIILPNGKNVSPEEIEEALMKQIPYIKECVVYAQESNAEINAIVYLDPEYRAAHGLETPEQAKAHMLPDFETFNSGMPGYKKIADFDIADTEFEKSTTHKIQRFKIAAIKK